jgi:hypothetical protein
MVFININNHRIIINELQPYTIISLDFENNVWRAEIVDCLRFPLDSKVLYHAKCGEFYNLETLKLLKLVDQETQQINEDLILKMIAENKRCLSCPTHPLSVRGLRICYPKTVAVDEGQCFQTLSSAGNYVDVKPDLQRCQEEINWILG